MENKLKVGDRIIVARVFCTTTPNLYGKSGTIVDIDLNRERNGTYFSHLIHFDEPIVDDTGHTEYEMYFAEEELTLLTKKSKILYGV